MIIKVCGLCNTDNARAVAGVGVDMIGFCFMPQSERYVSMISSHSGLLPDYSEERMKSVRTADGKDEAELSMPKRVGVFADDMPQNIVTRIYNYKLDYVQLNGEELPLMIDNLRRTLVPDINPEIKIIKTIQVERAEDFSLCDQYRDVVDMFLFTGKQSSAYATGSKFDWSLLNAYQGDVPFLLGGGISVDDTDAILQIKHAKFAGIDINESFEKAVGEKDIDMLVGFVNKLKQR